MCVLGLIFQLCTYFNCYFCRSTFIFIQWHFVILMPIPLPNALQWGSRIECNLEDCIFVILLYLMIKMIKRLFLLTQQTSWATWTSKCTYITRWVAKMESRILRCAFQAWCKVLHSDQVLDFNFNLSLNFLFSLYSLTSC